MRQFIINISVFVVIVGVLAAGLDWIITKGLHKRMDHEQEVWNNVMDSTIAPDLIVLGNCVAEHDHNTRILDSVLKTDSYVFAMSNLTFPYHNFMWNMLKEYHPHQPKMLVMAVDYSDLSLRNGKTNAENEQFLPLMYNHTARQFLYKYGGYSWLDLYVPCYRYFGHHLRIKYGILNFLGVKKYVGKVERCKGYVELDRPYDAHRDWYGKYVQPIDKDVVSMFDNFLCDCKKSGIEVLVVLAPIAYELSECIQNEEDIYHIYDSLAHSHGFECIHYVAPHWISMDTNYFESPNHLNKQGSNLYTLDLAQYIAANYQEVLDVD